MDPTDPHDAPPPPPEPAPPEGVATPPVEQRLAALEQQVHYLTWRLHQLDGAAHTPHAPAAGRVPHAPRVGPIDPPAQDATSRASTPGAAPAPTPIPTTPEVSTERWILRAGGTLLALGLAYLFRYSIERGWLGPGQRVALGAALGFALVTFGWLRTASRPLFAGLVQGAGLSALLLSIGAAFDLYDLIGPGTAALATLLALTLCGAVALPARLAPPWLVALPGAALLLGFSLDQAVGTTETWIALACLSVPLASAIAAGRGAGGAVAWVGTIVSLLLTTLYLADEGSGAAWFPHRLLLWSVLPLTLAGQLARPRDEPGASSRLALFAVLVPLFIGAVELGVLRPSATEFLLVAAFGVGVLLIADRVARFVGRDVPSLVWAAGGIALLSAVRYAPSGDDLPLLLVPFVAGLAWHAGTRAEHLRSLTGLAAMASLVGALGVAGSVMLHLDGASGTEPLRVAWLLALPLLLASAWRTHEPAMRRLLLGLTHVTALGVAVGTVDELLPGTILSSLVWAALAVALLVRGFVAEQAGARQLGLATLAALMVKVLFWDLHGLETLWRVLALMGMGLVFLALGYFVPGLLRRSTASGETASAEGEAPTSRAATPPEDAA